MRKLGIRLMILATFAVTILIITLAGFLLPNTLWGNIFFGLPVSSDAKEGLIYPFTIQNLLHLLFAWGISTLLSRAFYTKKEATLLSAGCLPENDEVLRDSDLGALRKKMLTHADAYEILPTLIDRAILQFKTQYSIEQVSNIVRTTLELQSARLNTRYSLSEYIIWVIPTVGFIGTIIGIARALIIINQSANANLQAITGELAFAFNTTLVALMWSALLNLVLQVTRSREEAVLVDSGDYVVKNFVNRLVNR